MSSTLAAMLVEGLRANHESVEPRPRNPAVEEAWNNYADSWAEWARLAERSIHSSYAGYREAELIRQKALIQYRKMRDEALVAYFQAYDQDQLEAFGG